MAHAWAYACLLSVVRVVHFGWTQTSPAIIHYLISNHINHVRRTIQSKISIFVSSIEQTPFYRLSNVHCSWGRRITPNQSFKIEFGWDTLIASNRSHCRRKWFLLLSTHSSLASSVCRRWTVKWGKRWKTVDDGMIRIRMRMKRMSAIETIQMEN